MKIRGLIMCFLTLVLLTGPVCAHTTMTDSNIKQGDVLTTAPRIFECTFSSPLGLAALNLKKKDGTEVPLDFTKPDSMQKRFSIPLPTLVPGDYAIEWRAIARDGHVMNGVIEFTLTGPGQ